MKTFVLILALALSAPAIAGDYASTASSSVVRSSDGATIPADPLNADYQQYQVWRAAGGIPDAYVAPPTPVPQTVSAMQAKVALLNAGKLDAANAWVAAQNAQVQLIWSTATTFNRNSALMNGAAAALGWSQSDLDALFTAAAAINP
jgi:hypothetical protein